MLTFAVTLLALAAPQGAPTPDAGNYRQWMERIEPNATELGYLRIAWRNKLWPAVLEARDLGRPILLWTMNGHPLGCT